MLKIEEKQVRDGYDLWGKLETITMYVVTDNEKEIYKSKENPQKLVDYINKLSENI